MSKSVSDDPLLLSVHFDFEYQKTKESGFVFYTGRDEPMLLKQEVSLLDGHECRT